MKGRNGLSRTALVFIAGAVALGLLIFALVGLRDDHGPRAGGVLRVFCAAGLKPPVEELAGEYEERYGVRVDLSYGGSGALLSTLALAPEGDLYLAGDDSFTETAHARGLVAERFPLARMTPVIAVPSGNPRSVASLADLGTPDLRLGLADPEAAAVGKVARLALERSGRWKEISAKVTVFKPTVTDLAIDLRIGALDAAILWDATVAQTEGVESISVPELSSLARNVELGVLTGAASPAEALRFARFLASSDVGSPRFAHHGYTPLPGDRWNPAPELLLFSGAMLNSAIDETITAFEEREGVVVTRVYNGCGILVAQMKAGASPDAYFSCDTSFLEQVANRFGPSEVICANRMVMLVRKGNPEKLSGLADLAREGLKVGLAHPEKSALGALTRRLLDARGLEDSIVDSGNIVVESPTADYLVAQIRTGALDAVIVYRSSAAHSLEDLDLIELGEGPTMARQPYAVARGSEYPLLMERLLSAIRTDTSRSRFESLGFTWEDE
jgi:molybdate transport system substrate-binding protein